MNPPRSAFGAPPQGATPAARQSRIRGVRLATSEAFTERTASATW